MCNCSEEFKYFISKALQKEILKNYEVQVRGRNEKGEGYMGDITFVDVFGEKNDGEKVKYALVLKIAGKHKTCKKSLRLNFEREIHIYSNVLPSFQKLQVENGMEPFRSLPKCYLTSLSENQELLILQNIKDIGYKLHDRKTTMNLAHMKLVMKLLGQWHALSFALKEKHPEVFKNLTKNWKCPATEMFVNSHVGQWLNVAQDHLYSIIESCGELELLQRYKEKIGYRSSNNMVEKILKGVDSGVVVAHGDCWNNNLMFKYQDQNETLPCDVKFLDFQISTLSSPVIDLSYFIYGVTSQEVLTHFEELLQTYHWTLSEYLKNLHSSPDIFSYSTLKHHWMKYSGYGALIQPLLVCDALVEKNDAANYQDKDGNYKSIIRSVDTNSKEAFTDRLLAVARHFADFVF